MEKNNAQEEIIHTVNGQLLVVACPAAVKQQLCFGESII